ncbi:hypothetical protein [Dokdonella sp.]|uniref:hypothetical protein n=1 Tax=Dokdonella sp. TaxID=2291710 RepID=UPI0035281BAB
MIRELFSAGLFLALTATVAVAQSDEDYSARVSGNYVPGSVLGGGPIAPDNLFAGTALNGPGTNNNAYLIDPVTSAATALLDLVPIWGATFDPAGNRILYTTEAGASGTVDGAPLFEIPIDTGTPALLGVIRDDTGAEFRIDGLAMSGGVLYGSRAAADRDGIYSIDMTTFTATLLIPSTDSISGIDADPATGTIYGVDDTIGSLVQIDIGAGTITPVVAYPDAAETDIDGLAVGNNRAYLIPDDNAPGLIYVYNLQTASFETPLTAPWGVTEDTFAGGAYISGAPEQPLGPVAELPVFGTKIAALLALLLGTLAIVVLRRRATR